MYPAGRQITVFTVVKTGDDFVFQCVVQSLALYGILITLIFVFLTIAALSFLGVGIQPPTADWGSMVRETAGLIQFAAYDTTAAITPMLPAAAIALLTVAVNFVVDWFLHKTSGLKD